MVKELIEKFGNRVTVNVDINDLREIFEAVLDAREALQKQEAEKRENDRLLDVEEVSQMLGVCSNSLWRWNRDGYLKPIKVGRKNRYKLSEVKRILEGGNA